MQWSLSTGIRVLWDATLVLKLISESCIINDNGEKISSPVLKNPPLSNFEIENFSFLRLWMKRDV